MDWCLWLDYWLGVDWQLDLGLDWDPLCWVGMICLCFTCLPYLWGCGVCCLAFGWGVWDVCLDWAGLTWTWVVWCLDPGWTFLHLGPGWAFLH